MSRADDLVSKMENVKAVSEDGFKEFINDFFAMPTEEMQTKEIATLYRYATHWRNQYNTQKSMRDNEQFEHAYVVGWKRGFLEAFELLQKKGNQ